MADHGGTSTYRPSLTEVLDGTDLTSAEQQMLAACKTGDRVIVGDDVPEKPTDKTRVRAALIRYLLLGGCNQHQPHPKGVDIIGAWIDGALDFRGCETGLELSLHRCHFPETPVFGDARLGALFLTGSHAKNGVNLHRLRTETSVHLRDGFRCSGLANLGGARIGGQLSCSGGRFEGEELPEGKRGRALTCNAATVGADVFLGDGFAATGEVDLRGAAIGGQLACDGASFDGAGGIALDCEAVTVGADVFLRDGFAATGEVDLRGAAIGGQLSCSGGRFDGAGGQALTCNAATVGADVFLRDGFAATGEVRLVRARIEGNLQITSATLNGAVDLESARIGEGLFWQDISGTQSVVNLTETQVGVLRDQAAAWTGAGILRLSGFRYDRLQSSMGVQDRIDWLARDAGPSGDNAGADRTRDFDPQPFTQFARTLDDHGHRRAAARVLYQREKRLRRSEYLRARDRANGIAAMIWARPAADLRRFFDGFFGVLFGYGHRPMRALIASVVLWAAATVFYGTAYKHGQFAPSQSPILASADWQQAVRDGCDTVQAAGCEMPLRLWERSPSAQDCETFSWGLYGLDLFVPLVTLGQEATWAPSKIRGPLGWWGFYLRWVFQAMGWIITAIGAATLTGLVGRKD